MKPFILLFILAAYSYAGYAQTQKEDIAIVRAIFQKDKKELIKETLELNAAQSKLFWPKYDEYEAKRIKLSTELLTIINNYANKYDKLTNQDAMKLTNQLLANSTSLLTLQRSYFPVFVTLIGGKKAAQFYQLESYIQNNIRLDIQNSIPFIDELKSK